VVQGAEASHDSQLVRAAGRKAAVVNLDPANDLLPYEVRAGAAVCSSRLTRPETEPGGRACCSQCAVNVSELVTLQAVQRDLDLGPNGGLVYCMEYLAANTDWLAERLRPLLEANTYLLFDCPGQVELFNVHDALQKVVAFLTGSALHIRHASFLPALRSPPGLTQLTCAGSPPCTWWTATCAQTRRNIWRRCWCR